MYRLFIVDDEPSARYGLMECFDWSRYGMEVVGEAEDGDIALEEIQRLKPDIVFTDVRMPQMDGIQLALKIKKILPDIKIVFVSGFDDLEYIKTALKLEALDYILKPVDFEELEAAVKKVLGKLFKERENKDLLYQMNIKLMQSIPLLREKFLMTLVRDKISNMKEAEERIRFLGLNLPVDASYCIVVISVDDSAIYFDGMQEKDKQLTSFAVLNLTQELVESVLCGVSFENRQGEYVCILNVSEEKDIEKIYPLCIEIKDSLLKYLQISTSIGIGVIAAGLAELPASYAASMEALEKRIIHGKNKILYSEESTEHKLKGKGLDFTKMEKLSSILKAANHSAIVSHVEDIFEELLEDGDINLKYLQNICHQVILTAARVMMELGISPDTIVNHENRTWEMILKVDTVHDMRVLIKEHVTLICRVISERETKKSRNIIEQVKSMIHNKYFLDLSLHDIAGEVYLTTTHLCFVFKQETGETVNDYLTRFRIEKAKELLADHQNKLYDICYSIGYSNPSYFAKIFKKYTGVSPSEYREKRL